MPLIAQVFDGQSRNMAVAVWGTILGACGAVAPVIGGLLVDLTEWRHLFLINVPIGVAALVLCRSRLPADTRSGRAARIDWTGAGLLVVTLGLINFALTRGEDQGWSSSTTVVQLVLSAFLLLGFVLLERRVAAPTLDLTLFKVPTFVAVGGSVYYILYFQSGRGLSPLQTGLFMMAVFGPQLHARGGAGLTTGTAALPGTGHRAAPGDDSARVHRSPHFTGRGAR